MLRMQDVIYERGSGARQPAAGAGAGAGPGRRCWGRVCAGAQLFLWPDDSG